MMFDREINSINFFIYEWEVICYFYLFCFVARYSIVFSRGIYCRICDGIYFLFWGRSYR